MGMIIQELAATVTPASAAQSGAARARLTRHLAPGESLGAVGELAARLAGARHAPQPRVERVVLLIAAGDHGIAASGIDLGDNEPTLVAARQICAGAAAVNALARQVGARLIVVDCGMRGVAGRTVPGLLSFRQGDGTADSSRGPAMTPVDAVRAIETGVAVVISLADDGLDVLALGHLAAGSQPASAALIAALTGASPAQVGGGVDAMLVADILAIARPAGRPVEALAAVGGYELAFLAGAVLAAASINVPVVLDDHGTAAAALAATRLAPAVTGYLIAAHGGSTPAHRVALAALGLAPLFDLGLSAGEGAGAALLLPFVSAAAGLLTAAGTSSS